MRHRFSSGAVILGASLLFAASGRAQLGPDSQPQRADGVPLKDDGSCASNLARRLWGVAAKTGFETYDPTRDAYPPPSTKPAMKRLVTIHCDDKAEDHADLPLLIHGSLWRARSADAKPSFYLLNSEWQVYAPREVAKKGSPSEKRHVLLENGYHIGRKGRPSANILTGPPPLYGARKVRFLALSCFLNADGRPLPADSMAGFPIQYKIGTTAVASDLQTDFNALVSAFLGKPAAAAAGLVANFEAPPPPPPPLPGETRKEPPPLACQGAYAEVDSAKLPVNLNITVSAGGGDQGNGPATDAPPAGQPDDQPGGPYGNDDPPPPPSARGVAPTPGPTTNAAASDCSNASASKGCTLAHPAIPVALKEAVAFGLGIPVPGTLEPQYASSSPANLLQPKRTTNLYGFVNLFPFAGLVPKSSLAPSFVAGIPVSGQPFYRPFFGIGESLNGVAALNKILPMQINFLAGVVWLNQESVVGNGSGGLRIGHARTLKKMFGVEVPVGALVSKISSIGKSASSGGSGGGKN